MKKRFLSRLPWIPKWNLFPAVVLAGWLVAGASLALGQTAAPATAQIGPGSTGSISHGVTAATGDQPHKMLAGALTPETRQTLQKAMNSTPQE